MRKILKTAMTFVAGILASITMFAQENEVATSSYPKWICDKGYWVVESNIKTPGNAVIRFYNNDNIQVYSEKVEGMTINLKKRKTLMRLKKVLDEALIAWQQSHLSKDNAELVKAIFKQ